MRSACIAATHLETRNQSTGSLGCYCSKRAEVIAEDRLMVAIWDSEGAWWSVTRMNPTVTLSSTQVQPKSWT